MHLPILFKLGTSTVHDGIQNVPHFILRSDQRWPTDRLVAILVVNKYGLAL